MQYRSLRTISIIILSLPVSLSVFLNISYATKNNDERHQVFYGPEISEKLGRIEKTIDDIKLVSIQYHESINAFVKTSSDSSEQMMKLTERIYWLTWAIVGLTIALVVLAICTIILMFIERKEAGDRSERKFYGNHLNPKTPSEDKSNQGQPSSGKSTPLTVR